MPAPPPAPPQTDRPGTELGAWPQVRHGTARMPCAGQQRLGQGTRGPLTPLATAAMAAKAGPGWRLLAHRLCGLACVGGRFGGVVRLEDLDGVPAVSLPCRAGACAWPCRFATGARRALLGRRWRCRRPALRCRRPALPPPRLTRAPPWGV